MSGMDRETGKSLDGWAHVVQSIAVLLTTPKLARVMRRAVGSGLTRLVDTAITPVTLIDFYAATAGAIKEFEPRFRITAMRVAAPPQEGALALSVEGVYYPRGHLGDFSVSVPQAVSVPL